MKKKIFVALGLAFTLATQAQKETYIPKDMQGMDLESDTCKWSYKRMKEYPDFVICWEKGFGADPSTAPDLEGKNMKVDMELLARRTQYFYDYFTDSLKFLKPGSKAEKYRMMVMLNYSLEGTAYGGSYDGEIGALWTAPNRVQDQKMNCIAHELGHSFQSQISCDGEGEAWGGGQASSRWPHNICSGR